MKKGFFSILIFVSVVSCISLKLKETDDIAYSDAVDYILKRRDKIEWSKKRKPVIHLSTEVIDFNTLTVLPDLMSKYKIRGFSIYNVKTNQLQMVNHITDSLSTLDRMLNSDYEKKEIVRKPVNNSKEPDYILFFTEIKSNMLYAELLPFNDKVFKDKKRETVSYGKAYTFLFKLDSKNKIVDVLTGVNYNN